MVEVEGMKEFEEIIKSVNILKALLMENESSITKQENKIERLEMENKKLLELQDKNSKQQIADLVQEIAELKMTISKYEQFKGNWGTGEESFRYRTDLKNDEIKQLYLYGNDGKGMKPYSIGKKLGCSQQTILKRLEAMGILTKVEKIEEAKKEEPKQEELKQEEPKKEEPKKEEPKQEEAKQQEKLNEEEIDELFGLNEVTDLELRKKPDADVGGIDWVGTFNDNGVELCLGIYNYFNEKCVVAENKISRGGAYESFGLTATRKEIVEWIAESFKGCQFKQYKFE